MDGTSLPAQVTAIPGPRSVALVDSLARHECPAITARRARRAATLGVASTDPIVWESAVGANVRDVDGNLFVDLTAGFGVALIGHRHPEVVRAAKAQSDILLHAMGDAFPDPKRIALLERLAAVAPDGIERSILGLSGADAIDAAVKTALLATGRTGVLTFEGSYHGLSLGAVPLQGYKRSFVEPFEAITHPDVRQVPFGADRATLERSLTDEVGLVLVEPIQGRGGIRPAPEGWLAMLAELTRSRGALLAYDEIQTGLGKTGTLWAGDPPPDLLCVGKALAGGFPLSACMGTARAMDAWGASRGEAIHTQTFLGHPIGCAAALAVLDQLDTLPARCQERGLVLRTALEDAGFRVRGRGLMLGIEIDNALEVFTHLLQRGYLILPAGMKAEVLALTPPVTLTNAQIDAFVDALKATA